MNKGFILSFETCFKFASVTLYCKEKIETLTEERAGMQSTSTPILTKTLLTKHNLNVQDITNVIATKGPGTFTGIRVALSFIEGLCLPFSSIQKFYLTCFDAVFVQFLNFQFCYNPLIILRATKGAFYVQEYEYIESKWQKKNPLFLTQSKLEEILSFKNYSLMGDFENLNLKTFDSQLISDKTFFNSLHNVEVMQKLPHLLTQNSTPFYFRSAV